MARKKSRLRRIKRFFSLLLLLATFLSTGLLPPTFAHIKAGNSTVQSVPDAQSLMEQGRKFYEVDRFADAVGMLQQALPAFKASGDVLRQAMTLGNLSLAYQQLGQWVEAEGAIAQSLNLLKTSPNINTKERSQILAQVLDIQGRLQLALAKPEDALNTWRQASVIYTQIIAGVAFQAGARSTIASLWNLDDESTAVLMSQFYQELSNKKLTKAEALRRAQLALLQNPKYQRPRFWAPYVLLGNWL